MSFRLKFWLVIGLQILILLSLFGYNQWRLIAGEKVLLKLVPPYDPLSLLQGHYLTLNYEISYLEFGKYSGPTNFRPGEAIYVILGKKDDYYQAFKVSRSVPEGLFIKGKVISNYNGNLRIRYGIESYFISEKKAKEVEQKFSEWRRERRDIFVGVSLDKYGNPLIRKILIDKKEIDLTKIRKPEIKLGSRAQARDARRKEDIRQIIIAMKRYYDERGEYLQSSTMPNSIGEYMPRVPTDPGEGFCAYQWISNVGNPQQFCVWACLESGKFFAGSEKGSRELDNPPTDLNCW